MARPVAKDARTRTKQSSPVDALTTSLGKLEELLPQVEDLKQEGFPYRDAVRARVELHVRECAKLAFSDKSPEMQLWQQYRLAASSPEEVAATIAQLKQLAGELGKKRRELMGGPPAAPAAASPSPEAVTSAATASRPSPEPTVASAPATVPSPTPTITTTPVLEKNPTPPAAKIAPAKLETSNRTPEPTPVAQPKHPAPSAAAPTTGDQAVAPIQASASQPSPSPASHPTTLRPTTPIAPDSREQDRAAILPAEAQVSTPRPLMQPSPIVSVTPQPEPPHADVPSATQPTTERDEHHDTDTIIRKVCARFHTIARQLRLRGEYRATLDVEDDRDVQDLLYALLRYELDEVAPQEWTPSYPVSSPSVALVLPSLRLGIVAKKTKSGVGPRELGQQLLLDCQELAKPNGYARLVCFIYDPEGRIGNPRSLEAELRGIDLTIRIDTIIYPR
ncbi:MAG: hypothetical protein U0172_05850 [Nitrospiraceae bacterium]